MENLTIVVVLVAKDTQLPWPEAALPCMRWVMVVPCMRRPASRYRGSWRPPAFSTKLFGTPELAAGGNCSGLDKLQLAWPEAALPRYAAGHDRSVLAAACLAVSLLGDRRPFSTELSCMAHQREGTLRRRPSNQKFVAVPKLKRNTSLSTTVSTSRSHGLDVQEMNFCLTQFY